MNVAGSICDLRSVGRSVPGLAGGGVGPLGWVKAVGGGTPGWARWGVVGSAGWAGAGCGSGWGVGGAWGVEKTIVWAASGKVARRDREEKAEYWLRDVPKFEGKYAEAEIGRVVGEKEKRVVIPFVWEEGRWKVGAAYRDGRSWDGEDF